MKIKLKKKKQNTKSIICPYSSSTEFAPGHLSGPFNTACASLSKLRSLTTSGKVRFIAKYNGIYVESELNTSQKKRKRSKKQNKTKT